MKKFYVLKIMMAVLLVMLLTVGNVFADRGWVQVTYNSNLSVGDTIIIAAAPTTSFNKAMGGQLSNNRAAVEIMRSGEMITSIGSACIFIVQAGNVPGTFAFFDPNQGPNGGYLYAAGGSSGNYLRTKDTLDVEGRSNWSIIYTDDGAIESIVAQTAATSRKNMRYNDYNDIFSCYTSGQLDITLYRYEEVQIAVSAPEFSPAGGSYTTPQTVSISCTTPDANILYTYDGSYPGTNGLEYSAPLTISTTTTLKAVAIVGTDTSLMSQATYVFPFANIAAFKAIHADNPNNTIDNDYNQYTIAGDVTYVFSSGRYMYVKDATAGLLIYDNNPAIITNQYTDGDVISGGLQGKYSKYNGQVELVPTVNPATSSSNTGAVQPVVVTIADLLANYNDYDAQLITLENVTFPGGFSGASQTTITQGGSSMDVYKRFSAIPLDTTLPAGTVTNVTGFVGRYNNTIQIYPRGNFDLSAAPQPEMPALTVTGIADGDEYSTLDTLHVNFDIQNFTLTNILGMGGDGYLKLEGALFAAVGLDNPTYLNATTLPVFLNAVLSPIPAGTHTVSASLVDMNQQPLTPAVSQTVTFTVTAPAAEAPVFSPVAGLYAGNVEVTLTCATPGAEIRYTIDNTTPTATSTLYQNPFTLSETATVKAKAFMNSQYWQDSPVAEASYTIVNEPTLSVDPVSLTFSSTQLTGTVNINSASLTDAITISCDNSHFTLSESSFPANVGNTSFTITYDGLEPATGTVTVSSGTLSTQVALVATTQLPTPVIVPENGTTDTLITVTMSSTVMGATIHYTIDNTEPTTTSPIYAEPIILNTPGTYTYKAIAMKEGWENSDVTTATYTIEEPVVPSIDTIMYSVGFESSEGFTVHEEMIGGSPAAVYNNTEIYYSGAENHQWGTFYGTPSTNAAICGGQSMQMRWYTSAVQNLGYTFTNFDLRNVTYVTFDAKESNNLKLNVSYSVDGGNNWVGDSIYSLTTNRKNYRFNVSETGEYNFVRLKFTIVLPANVPSSNSKMFIDSVVVYGVPGIEVNVVETPVISPNSGAYRQPFDATITCATDGAVIRYTTDGAEPTESSAIYSSAVTINGTTTLKAKAWKNGMEASMVATANYTFPTEVSDIAAFKAEGANGTNNTEYKITGDVTFVFRSGKYMLVEDESAALMIYDNNTSVITSTYNEGDVISGGVFGKFNLYHGMVEMVPTLNTEASTSNTGAVTPMAQTIPVLSSQYSTYESRLVIIENVTFIGDKKFVNGTDTLTYYDNFGTIENEPEVGETGSITGFLGIYDNKVRVYPRDDNDFNISPVVIDQVATPTFVPAAGEYVNSVEVSISCATEDATIYYTVDGTEPDANAAEYTVPFTLTATTTVKAIAVKEGMTNSEVAEATYSITTGIRELQQQVSIYPNPTSSDVTLDLSGMNAKTVELFSTNGQLLNTVVPTGETMTLSLSQYAAGIYFVRIHSDNAVTTQKIVKK